MAKKRPHKRTHGVAQRIAKTEISREPGMYEPSAEALAKVPPPAELANLYTHNPADTGVPRIMGLPTDRMKPSTYEYVVGARDDKLDPLGLKRNVRDILTEGGSGDDEVDQMLLDMESKGLIEALPDGQMLVKGTREQLLAYGIDPTDKSIFEGHVDPPKFRASPPDVKTPLRHREADQAMIDRYMSEYSAAGYDDSDMVLAHGYEPGDSPMLFPRPVFEKARAAGEPLVAFTHSEMEAWRASEGEKASVRFVLDFNDDKSVTSTTRADLDMAWQRNYEEVQRVEQRLGVLNEKVASASADLLTATEGADGPGWTHSEITSHLKVTEDRVDKIIQDMLKAGHLEVHTRPDGEKAYRLNEVGRQVAQMGLKPGGGPDFDEDDPRFMSRQWFNDLNTHRRYTR